MSDTASPLRRALLPLLALSAGVLGMSAIWTTAAILSRSPLAWLAFLAALDMILLLRLTGMRPGPLRGIAAAVGTAVCIALSYWLIAATQFGAVLGLRPLESAARMGPTLASELTRLQAGPYDTALLALALLTALLGAWGPLRSR